MFWLRRQLGDSLATLLSIRDILCCWPLLVLSSVLVFAWVSNALASGIPSGVVSTRIIDGCEAILAGWQYASVSRGNGRWSGDNGFICLSI